MRVRDKKRGELRTRLGHWLMTDASVGNKRHMGVTGDSASPPRVGPWLGCLSLVCRPPRRLPRLRRRHRRRRQHNQHGEQHTFRVLLSLETWRVQSRQ